MSPTQHKPPARRAFTGLAGSPLAQVTDIVTPDPLTQTQQSVSAMMDQVSQIDKNDTDAIKSAVGEFIPPKRRGRPPKFSRAMTSTERSRVHRQSLQEKFEDRIRRNLIAEVMVIYRRQQSRVFVRRNDFVGATDRRGDDRVRERIYFDSLYSVSVGELRQVLEALRVPDSHGRSELEAKTGGRSNTNLAILQAKSGLYSTNMIEAVLFSEPDTEQLKNMAGQAKVKPKGHGPDRG